MARDFNTFSFTGRICQDAQLLEGGKGPRLSFAVANNQGFYNADNEWVDIVSYFDCVLFGPAAERKAGQLTKGTLVVVQGRVSTSAYEDKDGKRRKSWSVIVDKVQAMAKPKSQGGELGPEPVYKPEDAQAAPVVPVSYVPNFEEFYD